MLVIGAAGQMLYEKFKGYEKYHTGVTSTMLVPGVTGIYFIEETPEFHTGVTSTMLVPGVTGIYFIEKTPELLKEEDEVSEDMLALIPNKNGIYPLRKKEELSLKECAREICAIILNHCYMTIEQMHEIAGLYDGF